jgi:exonuclease SbcD
MKILHTSDWHLGKHLNYFSRHTEQEEVLQEICEIADRYQVNAVLIAGDLFDTFNPPSNSVELFYRTLKRMSNNGTRAVIAIAGNHDSPDRIEAPDPIARECGIIFAGYPNSLIPCFSIDSGMKIEQAAEGFFSIHIPGVEEPLRVLSTPYANEYRLKKFLGTENPEDELRTVLKDKWKQIADQYCDNKGVNVMISHLLFASKEGIVPDEPEDERSILHIGGAQVIYTEDIPSQIQYTALGHLHAMQTITCDPAPVVYSGSPLAYSFSEADQNKYVQLIEVYPGNDAKVSSIELKKGKRLLRKRAESIEEALQWLSANHDALIELTMVTENYLTVDDRRMLADAHEGIVSLIPEVLNQEGLNASKEKKVDLTKDMEGLFIDYFVHTKCQAPNNEILTLFREVLAQDEQA